MQSKFKELIAQKASVVFWALVLFGASAFYQAVVFDPNFVNPVIHFAGYSSHGADRSFGTTQCGTRAACGAANFALYLTAVVSG